jgi:hypothetical protein
MAARLFGVLIVVVIAAAAVSAYSLGLGSTSGVTGTATSTTSITCTTTSLGSSTTLPGTYNASSQSPVRVDQVSAVVYTESNGTRTVQFEVGITNVGSSPVYIVRGCGSSLGSTIVQGAGVVKTVNVVRCLCAEGPTALAPGQSATLVSPGCWSGYSYKIVSAGTFVAELTLSWSGSTSTWPQGYNTTMTATFTVD